MIQSDMPHAALKPCSYPGCPNLVTRGRCSEHQVSATVPYVRDVVRHRLYDRDWQKRRKAYLAEHPWCEDCLEQGIFTPAVDVHHVIRHEGNREKFLSSPLRSLCRACHSRKTMQEVGGGGYEKF